MNESVIISLERYNEYLFYKGKYELLEETRKDLGKVLNDEKFNLKNPLHCKIYDIYAKLC